MPRALPLMTNTQSLLILGYGYVGSAFARYSAHDYARIWGVRRNADFEAWMREAGVEPRFMDLSRSGGLELPEADHVVSTLPPRWRENDGDEYLQSAYNCARALELRPPQKFVWISSTGVYGQTGGAWVDESTPPQPDSRRAKILLEAEKTILDAGIPSIVLRLGGIYGPGRDRLSLLRKGRAAIHSEAFINQIHLDDIVGIIRLLLEKGRPGEIYLGVDDHPAPKREFYSWLLQKVSIKPSEPDQRAGRGPADKRCSNRKIKALGYDFKYPSYREGFSALLSGGSDIL